MIWKRWTSEYLRNGSARVKMAHGELKRPVVKLAPVFYDGVSEIENRAGDFVATSDSVISTKQVDDMNSDDT